MLFDFGASAVELRDSATMTPEARGRSELVAGFGDAASRDRASAELDRVDGEDLEVRAVDIGDDGWSTRWREYHRPVVLDKLEVVAPWMTLPPTERERIVVDPGQAFGTGGHASTRLILQMLQHISEIPPRILDVGTGSGVLAIAAVKLGAEQVTAIDIDEASVSAARENAARNDISDGLRLKHATPEEIAGEWPLVLANLEIGAFQQSAAAIARLVAPSGMALLSGLLVEHLEPCLALWPGFTLIEKHEEDEWIAAALKRIP